MIMIFAIYAVATQAALFLNMQANVWGIFGQKARENKMKNAVLMLYAHVLLSSSSSFTEHISRLNSNGSLHLAFPPHLQLRIAFLFLGRKPVPDATPVLQTAEQIVHTIEHPSTSYPLPRLLIAESESRRESASALSHHATMCAPLCHLFRHGRVH